MLRPAHLRHRARLTTLQAPMRRAAIVAVVVGAMLTVAPSSEARSAARTFTFYGSGWGHGLGMSQYGAYGLARKGWSHQQILRHYYQGTTVGPARQSPATLRIGLDLEARRSEERRVGKECRS